MILEINLIATIKITIATIIITIPAIEITKTKLIILEVKVYSQEYNIDTYTTVPLLFSPCVLLTNFYR